MAVKPFVLTGVAVEGSTLPASAFDAAFAPWMGREIDSNKLGEIVNAAGGVYEKSPIALFTVLVPEQDFANGRLKLSAIEGFIGQFEVRGDIVDTRKNELQTYLRRIAAERPLKKATLQRAVSDIRALPAFNPDLTFTAGRSQGEVGLNLKADDRPVQLGLGINNRGTAFLGRTQVQADMFLNAPLTGSDQLRATVVLPTEPKLFQYYALAYSTGLGTGGTSIAVNGSYLRTRPKAFPLAGDARFFGAQLSQVLVRNYRDTLVLTAALDGLDSDNALLGFTISNDRVRTGRLSVSFGHTTARSYIGLNVSGSFGIPGLGLRVDPGFADRAFKKFNARLAYNQQIGRDFFSRFNAFGQATSSYLPSSEQMSLGGDEFGRGYEASLISGDKGYAGSLEIVFQPQKGLPSFVKGSEVYAFVDGGRVFFRDRFGGPDFESHLASVGGGVRLRVRDRIVVGVEGNRGLTNPVFYENHKRTRLVFSLRSLF